MRQGTIVPESVLSHPVHIQPADLATTLRRHPHELFKSAGDLFIYAVSYFANKLTTTNYQNHCPAMPQLTSD